MTEPEPAIADLDTPETEKAAENSPGPSFADAALVTSEPTLVYHNFDGDDENKYRLCLICTSDACKDFDDTLGKRLNLVYWYCHSVELYDDDSKEVTKTWRTVLIAADGTAFACVSEGIVTALQLMVKIIGPGPYDPPRPIKPVKIKTSGKNHIYKFAPVTSED